MIVNQVKSSFKYIISLAVAAFLFWYVYKDLNFSSSVEKLKDADYSWVLLSIFLSILSHIVRAWRWNLLLKPAGFEPKLSRTFWAVMVGYLANLIVPRMGEVSKCGILKKTDDVPMTISIGTVVAERIIDFLSLLVCILLGFIVEFDRLSEFLTDFFSERANELGKNIFTLYILAGISFVGLVAAFLIARLFRDRIKRNPFFLKMRSFLREMVSGVTSISRVKNQLGFWLATIMIWAFYYLMSYVVIFALDSTSSLGMGAGIALLIMGGLGMAAPVQGGIGAYHALVSAVLILYGIQESDGQLFAFLLHTSQVVMIIIMGSVSLVVSMVIKKNISGKKYKIHAQ